MGLLIGIGGDLGLLAVRVARSPTFFVIPGALSFLIKPVVPLGMYAVVASALPWLASRVTGSTRVLRVGTKLGLIGGIIEVVSTTLESLVPLPQSVVAVTTLVAMGSLFLFFGGRASWASDAPGSSGVAWQPPSWSW